MQYQNLNHLIQSSTSSRNYFLSLPVERQIQLHQLNDHIHSLQQLHLYANILKNELK